MAWTAIALNAIFQATAVVYLDRKIRAAERRVDASLKRDEGWKERRPA